MTDILTNGVAFRLNTDMPLVQSYKERSSSLRMIYFAYDAKGDISSGKRLKLIRKQANSYEFVGFIDGSNVGSDLSKVVCLYDNSFESLPWKNCSTSEYFIMYDDQVGDKFYQAGVYDEKTSTIAYFYNFGELVTFIKKNAGKHTVYYNEFDTLTSRCVYRPMFDEKGNSIAENCCYYSVNVANNSVAFQSEQRARDYIARLHDKTSVTLRKETMVIPTEVLDL